VREDVVHLVRKEKKKKKKEKKKSHIPERERMWKKDARYVGAWSIVA
jgi:hypothetical protein